MASFLPPFFLHSPPLLPSLPPSHSDTRSTEVVLKQLRQYKWPDLKSSTKGIYIHIHMYIHTVHTYILYMCIYTHMHPYSLLRNFLKEITKYIILFPHLLFYSLILCIFTYYSFFKKIIPQHRQRS